MTSPWPEDDPRYRTSWSADDLLAADFPAPRYAIPGLVPEGLTLAPGAPKLGKSWAWLGIALEVARGGKALGVIPVEQGQALYLALEDPPRRLQRRLRTLLGDEPAPAGLHFETEWPHVGDGAVDRLRERLGRQPGTRLVVIDVLARMRPPGGEGSNRYDADYRLIAELKTVADQFQVAVVVIHHVRKQGADDFLDMVSGTHGLAGAADAIALLQRGRGTDEATLSLTGRDIEEAKLALRFDATCGRWTLLGDAAVYELTDERRQVVQLLEWAGPLRPKQIADELGIEHNNAKQLVRRMTDAGQLHTDGRGAYSNPLSPLSPLSPGLGDTGEGDTSDMGDTPFGGLSVVRGVLGSHVAEEWAT